MPRFDLLIAGAELATETGLRRLDLAIQGGRIAAWLAPGTRAEAAEHVDAAGLVAMPGLVDAHVHFREPGLTWKEDFASGTAAAAVGGVTTALVMPTDDPLTTAPEDLAAKRALAEGRIAVDIGLQGLAAGPEHVAALARAGAVSVEVFLGDVPAAWQPRDNAALAAILDAARQAGIVVGISPADDGVVAAAVARAAPGRLGFFRSRPPLSESLGTVRALACAAETGAALHLRQVSCRASLAFLADALARGLDVTAETTPHYLLLEEAAIESLGPVAKVLPPLRPQAELDALWPALREGTLDMVATDHAPHMPEEKARGEEDILAAPGGFPGVQTLLPLMLDAVAAGRLDWRALLRACCAAPARRFGLAGKGSLAPGADADIVLVNPRLRRAVRAEEQLSRARLTPFAGRVLQGWPVATYLRGACIAAEGRLVGRPGGAVLTPAR